MENFQLLLLIMILIKACIFDLDGVIVDTAKYHFLAWKRLTQMLGLSFNEKDNEQLKGIKRSRSLEIILETNKKKFSLQKKADFLVKKNSWYLEYIHQISELEILPGVKKWLRNLKRYDIKIGLGSMSKNAKFILEKIALITYFNAVIDGNMINRSKPHPEVFLKCAETLGILPGECIVFEDAESGIVAARRANMYSVGIDSSLTLLKSSDIVISSLEELDFHQLVGRLENL